MRTLFEKFLQENNIDYYYERCPLCRWKIYILNSRDHEFAEGDLYNWIRVINCPKCNKVHIYPTIRFEDITYG